MGLARKNSLSAPSETRLRRESSVGAQLPVPPPSLVAPLGPPILAEEVPFLLHHAAGGDVKEDVPLQGLGSVAEWKEEGVRQWMMAVPISGMNVFDFLLGLVSVCFVGHLGAPELAAAALSSSVANATGFSVLEGLASAMETLCGQAFGAGQTQALGVILQRALLIITLACLPIQVLWSKAEQLLLLCGQDPSIAAAAGSYIRCLMPGLFATAWTLPLAQFLQAQSVVLPLAGFAAATLMIHVPANYLLIHTLGLGFRGAAWASSLSSIFNLVLLASYLLLDKTGMLQRTWGGWSKSALSEWGIFMLLALPACAMVCLEWWCFELITLLAGLLPDPQRQVSGMTICFNMAALCFMLPLGLSTAASVRVSNELGANEPERARRAVHVAIATATALGFLLSTGLLVFRDRWARLFTNEDEVVRLVADLTPFLVVSQFGIALQAIFSGVLRGSGQQLAGSIINFMAYYGVALPLAAYLAFRWHRGIEGLWWGLMLGATGQLFVLLGLILKTDWQHQVKRAKDLLRTLGTAGETVLA